MAGLNKICLIGHLGGDPEVKTISSGQKVAKMTLAVSEKYKNKAGETVTNTEWFDLEAWEGTARIAEQYLKKGAQVYLEGKQKTEKWETESGEKRSRKVVRITLLTMLGTAGGNSAAQHSTTNEDSPEYSQDSEDDLPF